MERNIDCDYASGSECSLDGRSRRYKTRAGKSGGDEASSPEPVQPAKFNLEGTVRIHEAPIAPYVGKDENTPKHETCGTKEGRRGT